MYFTEVGRHVYIRRVLENKKFDYDRKVSAAKKYLITFGNINPNEFTYWDKVLTELRTLILEYVTKIGIEKAFDKNLIQVCSLAGSGQRNSKSYRAACARLTAISRVFPSSIGLERSREIAIRICLVGEDLSPLDRYQLAQTLARDRVSEKLTVEELQEFQDILMKHPDADELQAIKDIQYILDLEAVRNIGTRKTA